MPCALHTPDHLSDRRWHASFTFLTAGSLPCQDSTSTFPLRFQSAVTACGPVYLKVSAVPASSRRSSLQSLFCGSVHLRFHPQFPVLWFRPPAVPSAVPVCGPAHRGSQQFLRPHYVAVCNSHLWFHPWKVPVTEGSSGHSCSCSSSSWFSPWVHLLVPLLHAQR